LAPLFRLVEELTQIHHLTDRWIGIRGYFYQIKFSFLGNVSGFFCRYDS